MRKSFVYLLTAAGFVASARGEITVIDPTTLPATQPATQPTSRPVDPKPLSENVKKGLDWIVKAQLADGGWGQGDESSHMGQGMANLSAVSNVADSCVSIMALMRSGSTPSEGPFAQQIAKGVEFVCGKIDASDNDSLHITDVRGTRVQTKIGTHVDTFLAAQVLSDVKGCMPDAAGNDKVATMLAKTLRKIEKNQKQDGGFAQQGWAPALAEGIAAKAVNNAAVRGEKVSEQTLQRLDDQAKRQYDEASGKVAADGASAGVALYGTSSNVSNFANADLRYQQKEKDLQAIIDSPTTQPEARDRAVKEMSELKALRQEAAQAQVAAASRMNDPQFASGFGSNGGEEFLSYLNIGESMVLRQDPGFPEWDSKMTSNLNRVQNDDGSWSGHHCITGKNFCTASALLVLMVDRTQAPSAEPLKRR